MQFALYQLVWSLRHVVTQVIKTKFVVGTVCNVSQISVSTLLRVWLMLIDTIYRDTVEFK
ncbi:hypothetical protein D3C86_1096680 [compost metagenome]